MTNINNELASNNKKKNNKNIVAIGAIILALLMILFFFAKIFFKKEVNNDVLGKKEEVKAVVTSKEFNFIDPEKEVVNTKERDFSNEKKEDENSFIGVEKDIVAPPVPTLKVNRALSGGTIIVNKQLSSNNEPNYGKDEGFILDEPQKDMFEREVNTFKASSVKKSEYDPNLLLEQGTYIPCSLRQRLISNVGGQISCTVSSNVFSKSGNVVLLEKGTLINGMYKSGGVKRGSNQIFVIWQQARTASNLIVNLDSGSTDELGSNGLSGWVDNHFWERFGNAIVVSLISDVSSALSSQLAKDGNQNYLQTTQDEGASIASSIIEKMGDIDSTLYKNQGDKVGVFVARDIDFSSVYSLQLK